MADVDRMEDRLYITASRDSARKWSAFWVLLVLAAIIASAGVVADSTATVIGAMIVAPLMTPILGTALALVLADRRHLLHNVGPGARRAPLVVVAIGYLIGRRCTSPTWSPPPTRQVAGRVSPKLIDLTAALATGVVGAFALVRSDVSDTLPGVAIAISLVPPLAVVGPDPRVGCARRGRSAPCCCSRPTSRRSSRPAPSCCCSSGCATRSRTRAGRSRPCPSARSPWSSARSCSSPCRWPGAPCLAAYEQQVVTRAQPVAEQWAEEEGWIVAKVAYQQGALVIQALGSPPEADADALRADLDAAGLGSVDTRVTLVIGGTKEFPGT